MITEQEREFARNLINDFCIVRVEPGSRRLPAYNKAGNGYYTWQFYMRAAFFTPVFLDIVTRHFFDLCEEVIKDGGVQLCGVESASIPLLTNILMEAHRRGHHLVNVFSIRKERKTYGLCNWLEGRVLNNRPAMLIDDVISADHKTAYHGSHVLHDHGIPILPFAYSVLYKTTTPQERIKLVGKDVTVGYLFSLSDFELSLKDYQEAKNGGAQRAAE